MHARLSTSYHVRLRMISRKQSLRSAASLIPNSLKPPPRAPLRPWISTCIAPPANLSPRMATSCSRRSAKASIASSTAWAFHASTSRRFKSRSLHLGSRFSRMVSACTTAIWRHRSSKPSLTRYSRMLRSIGHFSRASRVTSSRMVSQTVPFKSASTQTRQEKSFAISTPNGPKTSPSTSSLTQRPATSTREMRLIPIKSL
mgnify:CR=1 FL=1